MITSDPIPSPGPAFAFGAMEEEALRDRRRLTEISLPCSMYP